jgi:hypothetical protein
MTSFPTVADRAAEFAWATAETLAPRLALAILILLAGRVIAGPRLR